MFLSAYFILYTALSNRNLVSFTVVVILNSNWPPNCFSDISWNWGKGINAAYSSPAERGAGRFGSA